MGDETRWTENMKVKWKFMRGAIRFSAPFSLSAQAYIIHNHLPVNIDKTFFYSFQENTHTQNLVMRKLESSTWKTPLKKNLPIIACLWWPQLWFLGKTKERWGNKELFHTKQNKELRQVNATLFLYWVFVFLNTDYHRTTGRTWMWIWGIFSLWQ